MYTNSRKGGSSLETLTILVADSSEVYLEALSEAMGGYFRVRRCTSGAAVWDQLENNPPDLMIVDLSLPGMDGYTVIRRAVEKGICPPTIATTYLVSDYIIAQAEELGIQYMMRKPFSIPAAVTHAREMAKKLAVPLASAPDPRTHASNLLTTLGVPTRLKGYAYLREAVLIMVNTPDISITKELYPKVASVCGCHLAQVERSMRTAVDSAWRKMDPVIWTQFFSLDADGKLKRPPNSQFIARLADRVQLDQLSYDLNNKSLPK